MHASFNASISSQNCFSNKRQFNGLGSQIVKEWVSYSFLLVAAQRGLELEKNNMHYRHGCGLESCCNLFALLRDD